MPKYFIWVAYKVEIAVKSTATVSHHFRVS